MKPASKLRPWETIAFDHAVSEVPRRGSVPQTQYKGTGRFPVVDQGAEFIAGYTDDEGPVVHDPLPLVVFGDHTRALKYVDFPFAPGADGTKLLSAREGAVDSLFLYYALLNLEIPSKGYNRHFKYLRESTLFVPSDLTEQQAIAGMLSKVTAAVELQEKIVAALRELKAATMAKLFREGLRGERRKQTEVGEIPKSWEVVRLGDVARIERGKFGHRPRNDPRFYGGHLPFIQTGDVNRCNGRVRTHTQTLNAEGLAVSKLFQRGTIVLTIAANIGDTGILEFDSCFPDSLVGIMPGEAMDAVFLEQFLRTQKPEMDRLAPKGTQKNITIEFLKPWPVVQPSIGEQRGIASALRCIDDSMETALSRLQSLRTLFSSTLHLLMTGQVRVPVGKEV